MSGRGLAFALAAVALLAGVAWFATRDSADTAFAPDTDGVVCTLPPAFVDDALPLQSEPDGMAPFRLGDADVTPLAGYSLEARVLSRKDYGRGNEAGYSPTDLVLGWGPMAAPGVADALAITQGGRWYRYRWGAEGPPLPPAQIVRNSANTHLIPADAAVADALENVREGDTVRLEGWLVRIERDDGWRWQSSLRRDDTGAGSCELVYVCALSTR
jgi:hypothetical protein